MLSSAVFINSHHFTEVLQQLSNVKEPCGSKTTSTAPVWTKIPSITVTCAEEDTKNEKTANEAGDTYNAMAKTVGNVKTIEEKDREESFSVYGRSGEEACRFNEGNEEMKCDQDETCFRTTKIQPTVRRCSKGFTAATETTHAIRMISASRITNNSEDTKRENLNTAQHGADKTECRKTSSQSSRSLENVSKTAKPALACSAVSENPNGGALTRSTETLSFLGNRSYGNKTNSNDKKMLNSTAKATQKQSTTQKQSKPTSGPFCFTSGKKVSMDIDNKRNSKCIDLSFKVSSNVNFMKLTGKGSQAVIKEVVKQGNNLAKLNSEASFLSFYKGHIASEGSVSEPTDFQTSANVYRSNKESSRRDYGKESQIPNNDKTSNQSGFQVGSSNKTFGPFDSKEKELHNMGSNFRSRHLHKTQMSRKENEMQATLCAGHSQSLSDLRKADADDETSKTRKALTGFLTPPTQRKLSTSKQLPTSGIHSSVNPLSSQLSRKIYLAAASKQWRPPPRSKSLSELQEATSAILHQAERELDRLDLQECLPRVTVEQVLKTWQTDHRHWNIISSIISLDRDENDAKRTDLEQVKQCRYIRDGIIHEARNARVKRCRPDDLQK